MTDRHLTETRRPNWELSPNAEDSNKERTTCSLQRSQHTTDPESDAASVYKACRGRQQQKVRKLHHSISGIEKRIMSERFTNQDIIENSVWLHEPAGAVTRR